MMHVITPREHEIGRYVKAYRSDAYGMGRPRQKAVKKVLSELPTGSVLDVGTGRGEALAFAHEHGHKPVVGTEVVPYLCTIRSGEDARLEFARLNYLVDGEVYQAPAHQLPFNDASFDHVTCFDVLEHLIASDLEPVLRELRRVARKTITVSASERSSFYGSPDGRDLHISARPRRKWLLMFRYAWGQSVREIGRAGASPLFQVGLS